MVWRMCSWHTFGPLIQIHHCLNATAYLNIVVNHVHPVVNEKGQRKRAILVEAEGRKVTVMLISTHYNSGIQKSISEHTMCQKPLSQ